MSALQPVTCFELQRRSEVLSAAGIGLCSIAEIMGVNGEACELGEKLKEGLAHAVFAIGEPLKENGNALWVVTEEGTAQ